MIHEVRIWELGLGETSIIYWLSKEREGKQDLGVIIPLISP